MRLCGFGEGEGRLVGEEMLSLLVELKVPLQNMDADDHKHYVESVGKHPFDIQSLCSLSITHMQEVQ